MNQSQFAFLKRALLVLVLGGVGLSVSAYTYQVDTSGNSNFCFKNLFLRVCENRQVPEMLEVRVPYRIRLISETYSQEIQGRHTVKLQGLKGLSLSDVDFDNVSINILVTNKRNGSNRSEYLVENVQVEGDIKFRGVCGVTVANYPINICNEFSGYKPYLAQLIQHEVQRYVQQNSSLEKTIQQSWNMPMNTRHIVDTLRASTVWSFQLQEPNVVLSLNSPE